MLNAMYTIFAMYNLFEVMFKNTKKNASDCACNLQMKYFRTLLLLRYNLLITLSSSKK